MLASITETVVAFGGAGESPDHDAHDVGMLAEIPVARAIADGFDAHRRHGAEARRRARRQKRRRWAWSVPWRGRASRSACPRRSRAVAGRGHGQNAVFGVDRAAAHIDGRAVNSINLQQVKREAGAHDVADGIHRAHFVEMDLFDTDAVYGCFSLRENTENLFAGSHYRFRQLGRVDHFQNPAEMAVFLLFSHGDAEFSGSSCRGAARGPM